jgi:beta-glucosidase
MKPAALALGTSVLLSTSAFAQSAPAVPPAQQKFLAGDKPARELLAQMTLDEKLGQMMQPAQSALVSVDDIQKYFLGSLLSGGGDGPQGKPNTRENWTAMVETFQQHAMATRLKIPLLYGIDAVHGHNNIPGATIFPHNIALGCTRDAALVEQIQRITAEEVRATAINWVFGPCVTVPQDIRWGRTYEGFSADTDIVNPLATAAVRGFQSTLNSPDAVVACAKHYIGDGGTTWGTGYRGPNGFGADQGDTRLDEATLRKIHLPPYIAAVNAGVATIMPSYSSWNGAKMSAQKYLLTDVLKGELGFQGFLISDYNALDQINPDFKSSVGMSINAGMDMVMLTGKYPQLWQVLHELVADKTVPLTRIDDAVTRILRVKIAAGLLDKNYSPAGNAVLQKTFGSAEHRAVARKAVQESLVLLKNQNRVLPLSKTAKRIAVAGRGADSPGMQCGGWTVTWQGDAGQKIPGATTILTGLKASAGKDTQVTYSAEGEGAAGADVAVVVIGENPYAEMNGDDAPLALSSQDRAVVARLAADHVPMVLVLLSGRPLILGDLVDQCSAIVAAWLPGSEGQGVADVLFKETPFQGKLSFPWPKDLSQLPTGKGTPEFLYPLGYGLSYE